MPIKMNMVIINNHYPTVFQNKQLINNASLGSLVKTSSALNSPFIARIHNAKAGCSSCGKK